MTQTEKRIWLIKELQKEMPEYGNIEIPTGIEEQWRLLRGLFNIRRPGPISEEFQKIESEYLQQMTLDKGITDSDSLQPSSLNPGLYLWQGDITTLRIDAIVNAANSGMTGCYQPNHDCIDNIEQTMAGTEMRYECYKLMQKQGHEEPTGQAKITSGYNLPAKYVLHTVGPIVMGTLTRKDKELLASCYHSCLELASEYQIRAIAFCCISTGVFMFPQDKAAEIAVKTVRDWLDQHPGTSVQRVVFNVFKDSDWKIYDRLLNQKG